MATRQRANRTSGPRLTTVLGLVLGAVAIGLLWVGGIDFPFYPPPGMVILTVGALIVALAPWRWVPGVGVFLGLFLIVGFLASGSGIPNLLGEHGAVVSVATVLQIIGVVTALVAGVTALFRAYRLPTTT